MQYTKKRMPITVPNREVPGLEKLSKEQKRQLRQPSGIKSEDLEGHGLSRILQHRDDRMCRAEFLEENIFFKLLDTGKPMVTKHVLLCKPGVYMDWGRIEKICEEHGLALLLENCGHTKKIFLLGDSLCSVPLSFTYDRGAGFLTEDGFPRLSTNVGIEYGGDAGESEIFERVVEAFEKDGFIRSDDIPDMKPKHTISVGHFFLHGSEISSKDIMLRYYPLEEIRGNYPKEVMDAADRIVQAAVTRDLFGRLVIMHGPAGTGKTTLIQSLLGRLDELESGYEFVVVSDPEMFLTKPGFYYSIIADKAKVVFVLEDVGDLMSRDNKRFRMAEVSNFLNMTDGIFARGREDIFITSFNYKLEKIEDAFDRPGRCLENIHFPRLRLPQAKEVLAKLNEEADLDALSVDYALSDLYALARGRKAGKAGTSLGFAGERKTR